MITADWEGFRGEVSAVNVISRTLEAEKKGKKIRTLCVMNWKKVLL
jgi:hypothetical protein